MKPLILCLVLVCFSLLTATNSAAQEFAVVPGERVGEIRLGDARPTVLKRLGKPSRTLRRKNALMRDEWLGAEPTAQSYFVQLLFIVTYEAGKVVQIEFNSPRFTTRGGISMRNSLAQFRAKHPNPQVRAYGYDDYHGYYYDDVRRGLAFIVISQDDFDASNQPSSLIIHLPGKPVIPDIGGTPHKPDAEIPVRPRVIPVAPREY